MYEKSLKGCLIYILKKIFTFQNTIKQSCLDTTNCGIELKNQCESHDGFHFCQLFGETKISCL